MVLQAVQSLIQPNVPQEERRASGPCLGSHLRNDAHESPDGLIHLLNPLQGGFHCVQDSPSILPEPPGLCSHLMDLVWQAGHCHCTQQLPTEAGG